MVKIVIFLKFATLIILHNSFKFKIKKKYCNDLRFISIKIYLLNYNNQIFVQDDINGILLQ